MKTGPLGEHTCVAAVSLGPAEEQACCLADLGVEASQGSAGDCGRTLT